MEKGWREGKLARGWGMGVDRIVYSGFPEAWFPQQEIQLLYRVKHLLEIRSFDYWRVVTARRASL
jgi:hypothetical protein